MSLYDREYMREGRTEVAHTRKPGANLEYRRTTSNKLGRGEQVGFALAAAGVIGLLLAIALL